MVKAHFYELVKELLSMVRISLFHSQCKICNQLLVYREEDIVCRSCMQKINPVFEPICKKCGKLIADMDSFCGECLVNPPPYRKHISYSQYDGILKDLILLYKYFEIKKLKKILARYYIDIFNIKLNERFDCIIPVPADKSRERDFDPNMEISKILSRELNIRLVKNTLVKVKKTVPQVSLTLKKRLKNLDGAFKLKNASTLSKKKVLLIDDVYTTGITIKKCAQILQKKKNQVVAITLARSK